MWEPTGWKTTVGRPGPPFPPTYQEATEPTSENPNEPGIETQEKLYADDWETITTMDITNRVQQGHCWLCGHDDHLAPECEDNLKIVGHQGHEVYQWAKSQQGSLLGAPWQVILDERHQDLDFWHCYAMSCEQHKQEKLACAANPGQDGHRGLEARDCTSLLCHIHAYEAWLRYHDQTVLHERLAHPLATEIPHRILGRRTRRSQKPDYTQM